MQFSFISLFMAVIFLAGCQSDRIRVYQAPKDVVTLNKRANTDGPSLSWNVPKHWQYQQPKGMRISSYLVPGENNTFLDFSVVKLSGDGGGLRNNINRWRGQLGLDPVADVQQGRDYKILQHVLGDVLWVRLENLRGQGMLVGIFDAKGQIYFFKLNGALSQLNKESKTFEQVLRTMHFE